MTVLHANGIDDTLIAGATLIVILGVAALLLRIMWRQRKRDAAMIAQLQAENADTTAYLQNLGAAIDADGQLLRHVEGVRQVVRVLASDGRQLLEQRPWIAVVLKRNDDYLGRVLAAVAEDQVETIAGIRAAVDHDWSVAGTYDPLEPLLARAND